MLYNEEFDDDEMAEVPIRKELPTTIELQNQYIDVNKDEEKLRDN